MRKKMFTTKGKFIGMAMCICLLSGILSGCGKAGSEKDSPAVNDRATLAPAPEATLAPTSDATPAPTPKVTPAPTPKATPAPTPEAEPESNSEPTQVSFSQKGAVKDSGKYKGLDWLVTDAGELIVTGSMEGEGLDSFTIWKDAPWKQYSKETTAACLSFKGAKSLRELFQGYTALSEVDLTGLDTGSVTNMGAMFQNCMSLGSIDMSGFDTSNVTGMSYMFCGCSSLTDLDLSAFDTSSARGMSYMFCGCSSLNDLDLSGFDTGSVLNMEHIFASCSRLQEVLVGEQWQTPAYSDGMFYGCEISSVTYK